MERSLREKDKTIYKLMRHASTASLVSQTVSSSAPEGAKTRSKERGVHMAVTEDILSHLITPRTQRAISEFDLFSAIAASPPASPRPRLSLSSLPTAFNKGWMTAVEDERGS
eukprot:483802-Hanusia_phi.AAC.2